MARGAHRNIERGRMRRDDAAPRDGDRIRLFAFAGRGDYYSGQRRQKRDAFPFLFGHFELLAVALCANDNPPVGRNDNLALRE